MFGLNFIKRVFTAEREIQDLSDRVLATEMDVGNHEIKLTTVVDSSGGYWKTKSGYMMRIRDMSSSHLRNCLDGGYARPGGKSFKNMREELARRAEAERWEHRQLSIREFLGARAPLDTGAAGIRL